MSQSAFSAEKDSQLAAREITSKLTATDAALVVFFAHIDHDGVVIGDALRKAFPQASVIGCSSNGSFADGGNGQHAVSALVIERAVAPTCATDLARIDGGVDIGISASAERLSRKLGRPLRDMPYDTTVGIALVEGATRREEAINAALGNAAPFVRFVGGSAGDDIKFTKTWAYCDGEYAADGCALAVLGTAVPFEIIHACNFESTGRSVKITKVGSDARIVEEIDGIPATTWFAEEAKKSPEELGFGDFLMRPLGLMIEDTAWLRSGVRVEGKGVLFACQIIEGTSLDVMRPLELVADTREKLAEVERKLGQIQSAVFFNCAYRMIEANIHGTTNAYHEMLSRFPHAGCQSNGETHLGHINQTLVGVAFGKR